MFAARSRIASTLLACAAVLIPSAAAQAAVFTVDTTYDRQDTSPGDGLCRAKGFLFITRCSLRAAIQEANALGGAHTIDIPSGTGTITLTKVGASENAAATGDLDVSADILITGNGVVIDGNASDRVFQVLTSGVLEIRDATLQNGSSSNTGGAIYDNGDLTLIRVVVSGNTAATYGGGIYSYDPVTLRNTQVTGNVAARGGGVYLSDASAQILDSTIDHNEASDIGGGIYATGLTTSTAVVTVINSDIKVNTAAGGRGGGVFTSIDMDFTDARLLDNVAATRGGGLYAYADNADVQLQRTIIAGNRADEGGGLCNFWSDMLVRETEVADNHADTEGGGIYNQGNLWLEHSTVRGNDANLGGGLYNYSSRADLRIKNSTLSGNLAVISGGGVFSTYDAVAFANNATIAFNTADAGAGGGVLVSSSAGTYIQQNTILGANSNPGGTTPDCSGTITSNGYDLITGTAGCVITGPATSNIYGAPPRLLPLGPNGGFTYTHALDSASPARDNGNLATCEPVDQRFVARPIGPSCDIGAFEL